MRRITPAITAALTVMLAAAVLLSGCDAWIPPHTSDLPSSSGYTADYTSEYAERWCYRRLEEPLRQCYGAMYAAVRDCAGDDLISIQVNGETAEYDGLRIVLPSALSEPKEIHRLYLAFVTDNPQFFAIGNRYSYEGYESGGVSYFDTVCLTFTAPFERRREMSRELDDKLTQILGAVPPGSSEFERELFLHDYLLERTAYDDDTAASASPYEIRPSAFNAYGALMEGSAVCEGFAHAMQWLLQAAGIPCTRVSGTGDGTPHMWNMVLIDGLSYHLDPTWNKTTGQPHTFFNVTAAEIRRNHTIDEDNIGLRPATATENNYFIRMGYYINSYSESAAAAAAAAQLNAGKSVVEMRFPADKYASAQLLVNNRKRFTSYVDPLLIEGAVPLGAYTYSLQEDYGIICVTPAPPPGS